MVEYGLFCNDLEWAIDPLGKFKHFNPHLLGEMCGFIPTFINPKADDIIEEALLQYGMMLGGPMKGGVIEDDGTYKYPGDPDMYPIAKCPNAKDKTVFIYEYGMTAFIDNKSKDSVMYRFD